jgi:hypothetical protein
MSIHRLVQAVSGCLSAFLPPATPPSTRRAHRAFARATAAPWSERLECRTLLAAVPPGPPATITDGSVSVTQVFVNSPGLTGQTSANGVAFRNLAGIDDTYGYPVPDGANQLKSIPWNGGVNQFALRFSQDVGSTLEQDDLVVRGNNAPNYTISGFTYDPGTKTGVWTMATPIIHDKVKLILDEAILPGLDGEWADGTDAYPSGDGTAGGDFNFRINIRRGDANQDGSVNALDLGQVKAKLNSMATNPGTGAGAYSVFADLNADGSINALDLGIAKANRDRPSPPPIEPAVTSLLFGTITSSPFLVTQVFVNGPGLTSQTSANGVAFRSLAGIDNTFGYPVPAGANQLKYIPWSRGIDRIAIRFNHDVGSLLEQDDLVVRGVNTVDHPISGFSYDPATQTGVWTLSTPVINDKLRLILDDAGVPGLDGDWTNGADAYPSGDGNPGGDFDFRINVLRGDANQDGKVNSLDLGVVKAKLNRTATNPGGGASGYSVFADVNADGLINVLDLGFIKAHPYRPLVEPGPVSLLFGTRPVSR